MKKKYIIVSLIFVTIIGLISIFSKTTFLYDESFSLALSHWAEEPITGWVVYDSNQWISKDLLNNPYIYCRNDFSLTAPYYIQFSDVHPPLFYMVICIISYIFKGRFSIYFYLLFNLLLLLISCFFVYKIICLICNNNLFASICSLLYGTCLFTLDNLVFIRMYQMASTLVIIYVYIALLIVKCKDIKPLYYIALFITIILGGLTHYYFYVSTLIFSLVLSIYLLIHKQYKKMIISICLYIVALLLNLFLFFPGTFGQFKHSHGKYVLENGAIFKLDMLISYLNITPLRLLYSVSVLVIILFLVYVLLRGNEEKKNNIHYSLIFCVSYVLYLIVVSQISLYCVERNMFLIDPICIIGLLISLYYILNNSKICKLILITIILVNCSYTLINNKILKEKSWDFAKKHQDDVAIVYVDKSSPYEYNDIQSSLFADLRWYIATYVSDRYSMDGYMDGDRNFVLYIDKRVDIEEFLMNAKKCFYDPNKYSLKKTDIETSGFYVYYGQAK